MGFSTGNIRKIIEFIKMANTYNRYLPFFTNFKEIVDFLNLRNNNIEFTIEKILQDGLE